MADKDFNMVKPVESPQNIAGLTPARRREERKRRQDLRRQKKEESEEELNEPVDEETIGNELTENENDRNTEGAGIDYCA